jgi:hypothetical protein
MGILKYQFINSGGRLPKFAMSCSCAHNLRIYTTLQTPRQENAGKSLRRAYCTEKVTICPLPYLPPLSCLACPLAPASTWDLFGNTRNLCDNKPLAPLEPAEPEPAARYYFDTNGFAVILLLLKNHRNLTRQITAYSCFGFSSLSRKGTWEGSHSLQRAVLQDGGSTSRERYTENQVFARVESELEAATSQSRRTLVATLGQHVAKTWQDLQSRKSRTK